MRSSKSRFLLSTRTLSFVVLMTAMNLISNYAMIGIPNIKFMDLFVFVSGYVSGVVSGVLIGVLTWLVYGTINPYGFIFPILVACCVGESLYGIVGGLSAKIGLADFSEPYNLKFGILGFLLTFVYDLFTNIVSGLVAGLPPLMAILNGVPFAVAHEVSNFFFFLFGCNTLIVTVRKIAFKGGEKL
ncbi:hypothetical protein KEJ34_08135 [Candidatus Bathyarchaeota archaeon]|nr:hypothetical protein [Candidatus Bathyarchaeota archaeon]